MLLRVVCKASIVAAGVVPAFGSASCGGDAKPASVAKRSEPVPALPRDESPSPPPAGKAPGLGSSSVTATAAVAQPEPAGTGPRPEAAGAETGSAVGDVGSVEPSEGVQDPAALVKEARTTKTSDERAMEALREAEAAGATVKQLARAAKARGDYLYKNPERARAFYAWSAEKDPEYAEPVFALAKQKALTGDLQDVVALLKQVATRKGGKALLEQIDFDPTWDIVKDDPDVRALL